MTFDNTATNNHTKADDDDNVAPASSSSSSSPNNNIIRINDQEYILQDDNPKKNNKKNNNNKNNKNKLPSLSDVFFNGGRASIDLSMTKSEHNPRMAGGVRRSASSSNHNNHNNPRTNNNIARSRSITTSTKTNKPASFSSDRRKSANDAAEATSGELPSAAAAGDASSQQQQQGPITSVSKRRGPTPGVRRARSSRTEEQQPHRQHSKTSSGEPRGRTSRSGGGGSRTLSSASASASASNNKSTSREERGTSRSLSRDRVLEIDDANNSKGGAVVCESPRSGERGRSSRTSKTSSKSSSSSTTREEGTSTTTTTTRPTSRSLSRDRVLEMEMGVSAETNSPRSGGNKSSIGGRSSTRMAQRRSSREDIRPLSHSDLSESADRVVEHLTETPKSPSRRRSSRRTTSDNHRRSSGGAPTTPITPDRNKSSSSRHSSTGTSSRERSRQRRHESSAATRPSSLRRVRKGTRPKTTEDDTEENMNNHNVRGGSASPSIPQLAPEDDYVSQDEEEEEECLIIPLKSSEDSVRASNYQAGYSSADDAPKAGGSSEDHQIFHSPSRRRRSKSEDASDHSPSRRRRSKSEDAAAAAIVNDALFFESPYLKDRGTAEIPLSERQLMETSPKKSSPPVEANQEISKKTFDDSVAFTLTSPFVNAKPSLSDSSKPRSLPPTPVSGKKETKKVTDGAAEIVWVPPFASMPQEDGLTSSAETKEKGNYPKSQGGEDDSVFDTEFMSAREISDFSQPSTTKEEQGPNNFDESIAFTLASPLANAKPLLSNKPRSLPSSPAAGKKNMPNESRDVTKSGALDSPHVSNVSSTSPSPNLSTSNWRDLTFSHLETPKPVRRTKEENDDEDRRLARTELNTTTHRLKVGLGKLLNRTKQMKPFNKMDDNISVFSMDLHMASGTKAKNGSAEPVSLVKTFSRDTANKVDTLNDSSGSLSFNMDLAVPDDDAVKTAKACRAKGDQASNDFDYPTAFSLTPPLEHAGPSLSTMPRGRPPSPPAEESKNTESSRALDPSFVSNAGSEKLEIPKPIRRSNGNAEDEARRSAKSDLNTTTHRMKQGLGKLLNRTKQMKPFNKMDDNASVFSMDLHMPSGTKTNLVSAEVQKPNPTPTSLNNFEAFNDSGMLSFNMDLAVPEAKTRKTAKAPQTPLKGLFSVSSSSRKSGVTNTSKQFQSFDQLPRQDLETKNLESNNDEIPDDHDGAFFGHDAFGPHFGPAAGFGVQQKNGPSRMEAFRETRFDHGDGNGNIVGIIPEEGFGGAFSSKTDFGNLEPRKPALDDGFGKLDTLLSQSTHHKSSALPDPSVCPSSDGFGGKLESLLERSTSELAEPFAYGFEGDSQEADRAHTTLASVMEKIPLNGDGDENSNEDEDETESLSASSLAGGLDRLNPLPSTNPGSVDRFLSASKDHYSDDQSVMTMEEKQFLQLKLPGMDGYRSSSSLAIVEHDIIPGRKMGL